MMQVELIVCYDNKNWNTVIVNAKQGDLDDDIILNYYGNIISDTEKNSIVDIIIHNKRYKDREIKERNYITGPL